MPEFAEWMVTAIEIDFPYPDTAIAKKDGSVAIGQRVFLLERAAGRSRLGVKRAELNVSNLSRCTPPRWANRPDLSETCRQFADVPGAGIQLAQKP